MIRFNEISNLFVTNIGRWVLAMNALVISEKKGLMRNEIL